MAFRGCKSEKKKTETGKEMASVATGKKRKEEERERDQNGVVLGER